MTKTTDLLLTALAPAIWGSTYLVTTQFLPTSHPLTVAMLRALPAGLLLLAFTRQWPQPALWPRLLLLGAFNFSIFWTMLFISAYRLPGGVAATIGAVQPLIVIFLERFFLGTSVRSSSVLIGLAGLCGVALLVLSPKAALDPVGVAAGLGGALSMAFGTVLSRKWRPDVPALTFTAWQMTAGGLLLLPFALLLEPVSDTLTIANIPGLAYLGLVGGAMTYVLWFRGLSLFAPSTVAPLGFLSPVVAVLLGWFVLDQQMNLLQIAGMGLILGSIWMNQRMALFPSQSTRS
jgi:probable blue pigment (indigoidine) exporter